MKKKKLPGDNISLKTKKNEEPVVLDWINSQTNLMDSIRYLIENEISRNGVRNLQNHIPAERDLSALPMFSQADTGGAGYRNEEIAAAAEAPARPHTGSNPSVGAGIDSAQERLEADEAMEASKTPPEDDEIDEEDIESWL